MSKLITFVLFSSFASLCIASSPTRSLKKKILDLTRGEELSKEFVQTSHDNLTHGTGTGTEGYISPTRDVCWQDFDHPVCPLHFEGSVNWDIDPDYSVFHFALHPESYTGDLSGMGLSLNDGLTGCDDILVQESGSTVTIAQRGWYCCEKAWVCDAGDGRVVDFATKVQGTMPADFQAGPGFDLVIVFDSTDDGVDFQHVMLEIPKIDGYTKENFGYFAVEADRVGRRYKEYSLRVDSEADWADTAPCRELAAVNADPHFVGFDGSKYDFQGEGGSVFNLISDTHFQMNAKFVEAYVSHHTYMDEIGFLISGNRVEISTQGIKVNGKDSQDSEVRLKASDEEVAMIVVKRRQPLKLEVIAHPFVVKIHVMSTWHKFEKRMPYLNIDCQVFSRGLEHPHGLLGQTAQYLVGADKPEPTVAKVDDDILGRGVLQGNPEDYLVSDGLLGKEFSFNRYDVPLPGGHVRRQYQDDSKVPVHAHAVAVYIPESH